MTIDFIIQQRKRQTFDRVEAYENELERLSRLLEWRPIETAPPDRLLVLFANCRVELGHFDSILERWVDSRNHDPLSDVTHWKDVALPMPALPGHPGACKHDRAFTPAESPVIEWGTHRFCPDCHVILNGSQVVVSLNQAE